MLSLVFLILAAICFIIELTNNPLFGITKWWVMGLLMWLCASLVPALLALVH
jgi:hypothetical protein